MYDVSYSKLTSIKVVFHFLCFQIASALAALHSGVRKACAGDQCGDGLLDNTSILYANAGLLLYPYF